MRLERTILLIWTWRTFALGGFAFNMDLTEGMARFFVSPVVSILGKGNASNYVPQLPESVKPSYYGYSLNLVKTDDGDIKFAVGAPKVIDPNSPALQGAEGVSRQDSKGSITECITPSNFFNFQHETCIPSAIPDPQEGDNFGLVVPARPDGSALACSSTRREDCGAVRYSPGSCFKSEDFGVTWNTEKMTAQPKCPTLHVEVLFVLDGSGSVGKTNFETVKNWTKQISKKIGLEKEKVTVGVVQYSHYTEIYDLSKQPWIVTHIAIGEYRTYSSFSAAVDKIKLQGYTTYTGQALRKVLTDFQTSEHYGKKSTKQVMILLTDGNATDKDLVAPNAQKLRDIGVIPYAVGVGENVVTSELRVIANGDPENGTRVFMAKNFDGLDAIAKELEAEIGGLVLEGQSGPNNTGYDMQFGQLGFSVAYGTNRSRRKRRDVSSNWVNDVNV